MTHTTYYESIGIDPTRDRDEATLLRDWIISNNMLVPDSNVIISIDDQTVTYLVQDHGHDDNEGIRVHAQYGIVSLDNSVVLYNMEMESYVDAEDILPIGNDYERRLDATDI